MSAPLSPTLLDLEVEALLLEVLRDPRARLLRSTPEQRSLAWLEPDPRVSSSAAGLTLAERQLLQHHREEVAWLLRQYAFEGGLQDEFLGRMICTDLPGGESVRRIGSDCILQRGGRALAALEAHWEGADLAGEATVELARLVQPAPDLLDLLLASMRLVPSPVTRLDMAYEALRRGHQALPMEIAERVAQDAEELSIWVPARSLQAVLHAALGRIETARMYYAETAEVAPDWPGETLSWYTSSIQVGNLRSALAAASVIDDLWACTDVVVGNWIRSVVHQRQMGIWSATPEAISLIPQLLDHVGATSRQVAHVF